MEMCTLFGSSAPRQRRGRNGLIGVSASSGALMGRIGPWADRLYAVEPAGVADEHAVADELLHAHRVVDENAQLGRLVALAEQRHLVDGERLVRLAGLVVGDHRQRMDAADIGVGEALVQILLAVVVHQEADRAAVHAVDRHAVVHEAMQRLQHVAVAAECHDGIGLGRIAIAIAFRQSGRARRSPPASRWTRRQSCRISSLALAWLLSAAAQGVGGSLKCRKTTSPF